MTGRRGVNICSFDYDVVFIRKLFATFSGTGWPDTDLHGTLKWGANENTDNSLPVCIPSANHKAAYLQLGDLKEIMQREHDKGFYGDPLLYPPSVPFGVLSMHLVPKPGGK